MERRKSKNIHYVRRKSDDFLRVISRILAVGLIAGCLGMLIKLLWDAVN